MPASPDEKELAYEFWHHEKSKCSGTTKKILLTLWQWFLTKMETQNMKEEFKEWLQRSSMRSKTKLKINIEKAFKAIQEVK